MTVRLPGARIAPATNNRTFCQVGRVNNLDKPASRNSRLSGSGDSQGGAAGSDCSIPCRRKIDFRPDRIKRRFVPRPKCGQTGRHDGT